MEETKYKKIAFYLIALHSGGGERVLLNLARGFVEDGFSVDLILFRKEGSLRDKIDPRINVKELKVSRIVFSLFPLIKYLNKEKPLFILGTSEHANLILILAKLFSCAKTKVFVRVGMTFSDLFKNYKKTRDKLIPLLIKVFYPYADKIIANSQNVAIDLEKVSKIKKEKIQIIYNPVFIQEIKERAQGGEWKYPNKLTILTLGRLHKQKDFETLMKAFALVKQKLDAQLIIVGEGGERNNLNDLIYTLNLEKDASLIGFVDNPYFYMKNSDIFVSSSLWEGFPNALIEAGVLGLPLVATDCGSGSRELLAPNSNFNKVLETGRIEYADNGILVAKQDIEIMAEAILVLGKNGQLRNAYSQKIKERVKEFDINNILAEYKKLL